MDFSCCARIPSNQTSSLPTHLMSRTNRNTAQSNYNYFRKPKTFNEIRQIQSLKNEIKVNEVDYQISKRNRMNRYIPTSRDDIIVSSYYERP